MQSGSQYLKAGVFLILLASIFIKPAPGGNLTAVRYSDMLIIHQDENRDTTTHSPRKAALLSAFLPGAGQAYNKKYWKIPVVYAAGAAGGYFIHTNHLEYKRFRQAYINKTDDDPDTIDEFPQNSAQQLKVYRDLYRRNMEFSVILTAAAYMLQILDATVDAHLFDFDVSDDLALKIQPTLVPSVGMAGSCVPGISLTLGFNSTQKIKCLSLNRSFGL